MWRRRLAAVVSLVFGLGTVLFAATYLYSLHRVNQAEAEFPASGRFVTVEGLRLHYVCEGEDRPVVLLHGNAGSLRDWDEVMERVPPGYRMCAFDRPGHCYSERFSGVVTPLQQARLLHTALWKIDIEKPLLVGHSWSEVLVLRYALDYPEDTLGLVLLGAVAYGGENS